MVRSLTVLALSFCVIAMPALAARAQETKTIGAEGVAAIEGNARDVARNEAVEDAQKRAVAQAVGILIDPQTHVKNYQLISDKILSQCKRYIKRYNVTGETVDSSLLRVRINAEVALSRLTDDLAGIGVLHGKMDTGGTRPVHVTITGLSRTEFVRFKEVLRSKVGDIRGLHERSFGGTTAMISVDSKVNTQTLSDEISRSDFGTFAVEVVGSTANSVVLKVTPK